MGLKSYVVKHVSVEVYFPYLWKYMKWKKAQLLELLTAGAFVGFSNFLIYLSSRRRRVKERVGVVSELFVFPVKSCPGVSVQSCMLTTKGAVSGKLVDRSFMFVKPNGDFISQRICPQLANVRLEVTDSCLILRAPDMEDLKLPFEPRADEKQMSVRVWDSSTIALDCGDDSARWAELFLQLPGARVVQAHPQLTNRPTTVPSGPHNKLPQDCANFQDNTPIHILSDASIEELNTRVDPPTDVRNFRPNIFATDVSAAYDEDQWLDIFIGNTQMHGMWLNRRCKLTIVDPNLGTFRPDKEPYANMRKTRTMEGEGIPCFGTNAGVDIEGVINVGDEILAVRGTVH